MRGAAPVCMELLSSVFFFGHSGASLIEQFETCGLSLPFRQSIESTELTNQTSPPALSYDALYKY